MAICAGDEMKILIVTEFFPPKIFAGGELSSFNLAKSLAEKGHNVSVLTSLFEGLKEYEEIDGFKIYRRIKTSKDIYSLWGNIKRVTAFYFSAKKEIGKIIKENEFDVIHCPNPTSGVIVKAISKAVKDLKIVVTINGYSLLCPKGNMFYLEKEACSGSGFLKCAQCIGTSQYFGKAKMAFYVRRNPLFFILSYINFLWRKSAMKDVSKYIGYTNYIRDLLGKNRISENKIAVIPSSFYPVEKNKEISDLKEKIKNKTIILSVSSLDKIKGVDLAIEAYSKSADKNNCFIIAGEGPEEKKLKELSEHLNIADSVFFIGQRSQEEIQWLYEKADIILLISLFPEPFSRVCAESSYNGKPLIATEIGGNKDFIVDGRNGFLVNPSTEDISSKMKILIKNAKLRKEMGRNARKAYYDKFAVDASVDKIIKVYKDLSLVY